MRNISLLAAFALLATILNAQVGINTNTIHESAMLEVKSDDKGFLPPRLNQVQINDLNAKGAVDGPATGLVVYNTDVPCLQVNQGTKLIPDWVCMGNATTVVPPPLGSITSLDNCANPTRNGVLTSGQTIGANVVSIVVDYSGGNGGTHSGQIVDSQSVTGLTATLDPGLFSSSTGSLTYNIEGQPSAVGNATFDLNIGGQSCTVSFPVQAAPGTIDNLDCGNANFAATLSQDTAIPSGVSFTVPYTGGNGGSHPQQVVTSTNVLGITATLSSGSFQSGAGSLEYVLSGEPTSSGLAEFDLNIGGRSCTYQIPVQAPAGSILSLDCNGATPSLTFTDGVAVPPTDINITYTGGNGGSHMGQTVTSTGVTGLTAELAPGSFNPPTGSLTYSISGLPSGSGTAEFALNIGNQTCTLSFTVNSALPVLPSTITIRENQMQFIASVFDTDYLPYSSSTQPAGDGTTAVLNRDNSVDPTVDYQGILTTTGVDFKMSVTTTGSGSLPAYSQTVFVPANLTEDGNGRNVTLSWPAQSFTSGQRSINANIKSEVANLEVKKLDINTGLGQNKLGLPLANFIYPINSAGGTSNFQYRALPGIPDRNINESTHQFLYIPVQDNEGNLWLNNNLGAAYSNLNDANFDPTKQASSITDVNAYGSLYQIGRYSDGHEFRDATLSNFGNGNRMAVGISQNRVGNGPPNANPIRDVNSFKFGPARGIGWYRADQNNSNFNQTLADLETFWTGEAAVNNPCPEGFRIPVRSEYQSLANQLGTGDATTTFGNANLFLPVGGFRQYTQSTPNTFIRVGTEAVYPITDGGGAIANFRYRTQGHPPTVGNANLIGDGISIRCIQD